MLPYSSSSPRVFDGPSAPHNEPSVQPAGNGNKIKVIIGSILGLIVLAGAVFAVYYLFFRPPLPNVSLEIQKIDQVLWGEPFKLTVGYTNASDQALTDATVVITVPEGMVIMGVDPSTRLGQQSIGVIEAGGAGSKVFDLIAINGENSVKRVSVAVRYRPEEGNSPAQERTATADVSVGGPAVSLNFDVPQRVFAGQVFDVDLTYRNNSKTDFQNAKLVFDYSQMFQFQAASSSPSAGNNEWDLGTLAAGTEGGVIVTGAVSGGTSSAQQSFFPMGVRLQVELDGHRYDLGSQITNIGLQTTPLGISIVANRKANYVSKLGDKLSYVLSYRNSSQFALQNLVIQAELNGEMLDMGTLQSAATLDSVRNVLTWNTANSPQLASLAPGESGLVEFDVALKKSWPIQTAGDKNFTVQVDSTIQSLSVPAGITAEQTMSSASLVTKISGQTSAVSLAYFKDPDATVVNNGPYPPRVNQPTQYTIHWQIRNHSTDITKVHMSGLLQSGARMVKVVRSNAGTSPVYNSQTGRVAWDIPSIPATGGLFGEPVEAVFQIEVIPAVNQLGKNIPLMDEITFSASDAFTGTIIESSMLAETSDLQDDPRAPGGDRKVQP